MKKHIQTAACAALVCVCLLGCGKQEPEEPATNLDVRETTAVSHVEIPDAGETAAASHAESTNTRETVASGTRHVAQELCDNLYIDAEAVIPGKDQYRTCTLKMVDSDPDRLFDLFCPEGHGNYTAEEHDYYTVYNESSGKQLVVYEDVMNVISYTTYNFKTEERPLHELKYLMYYHTMEHPNAAPHDLSFMSVEEMEGFGRDFLTRLGISWEPKLFRSVTLSGSEIMDFQQELFGDGGTYVSLGITPTDLTAAKDACYLQFNFAWDGIPLNGFDEPVASSHENFGAAADAKATILLNADGIQACEISLPCAVETVSDPRPILSLEEATALLKEKYDLLILPDEQQILDIWMEYIPVKQDEKWILTPYWCFVVTDERTTGARNSFGYANRFNAFTGEDLAYGG